MEVISDFDSFEDAIEYAYGTGVTIAERRRVSGGDINEAFCLKLSDGNSVFAKENSRKNADFFLAESKGLEALSGTKAIKVPKVHAIGRIPDKSFLLMDYLEPGRPVRDFWDNFGHNLADMHKADVSFLGLKEKYGFDSDNFIGAGPQKNTPKNSWITFFRDCRLMPQLERARKKLTARNVQKIEYLTEHLENYLYEPKQPSLLHGDLWNGNFVTGSDGNAWLIDPAVYAGCAEADIAMTELFGGFRGSFYDAYFESGLMEPGYKDRRDIYNLYHMLNHLNLFGGMYLYEVDRIVSRYVGEKQ